MRVIAGAAKGHTLETIEGLNTRPTTDRIKETLFNIIAFDLPECRFLDIFAGSGAIGIEALSRGAEEAVFVEQAANCTEVIRRNLMHTKLQDRARLLQMDAVAALDKLAAEGKKFDIIFALNEMTHPGEKRMQTICSKECNTLPDNFDANLDRLFDGMFRENISGVIHDMVDEIKKITQM